MRDAPLYYGCIFCFVIFSYCILKTPEARSHQSYVDRFYFSSFRFLDNNNTINPISTRFKPLDEKEISNRKVLREYIPQRVNTLREIDFEKSHSIVVPTTRFHSFIFWFLQWIGWDNRWSYVRDSEPNKYKEYTLEHFDITNSTFIEQFTPEKSVYLLISGNSSESLCRFEVSNILPGPLSSRKSWLQPFNMTDSELRKRNAEVDREIFEREEWIINTREYELMRSVVMKEKDSLYPSDHMDYMYTKTMYMSIRDLEWKVIEAMYQRIEATPCLSTAVVKYLEMNQELLRTNSDKLLIVRTEMEQEAKKQAGSRKPLPVHDHDVIERMYKEEDQRRGYRSEVFQRVIFHSDNPKHCDGCPGRRGPRSYPSSSLPDHFTIRKWIGGVETKEIATNANPIYPSTNDIGVTGITAATWNRLFSLRQMLFRWRGSLTVVLQCPQVNEASIINYINTHYLPSRLILILYIVDEHHPHSDHFPVNFLRNLAIRNTHTSHFLVLDMDLRMSVNTFDEIMRIPRYVLDSNQSAIILPIFFYNHTTIMNSCNTIESCAALTAWYQPEDKAELIACIHSLNCFSNKRLVRTHMYIMPEWYTTSSTSAISRIRCFITNFQEPYILVKYTPETPLFIEEFIDYGYNKVEYFENLRQMGYHFYILNHAFATDYPHPDSGFRVNYHATLHSDDDNVMKAVYVNAQRLFSEKYDHSPRFPVCYYRQLSYYEEILNVC